jgi:hypothetical protein
MKRFCYIFKGKDQDFCTKDMHGHIRVRKTPIIFFKNITLRARKIFHASTLKGLNRSYGYAFRPFSAYSLKNLSRAKQLILSVHYLRNSF